MSGPEPQPAVPPPSPPFQFSLRTLLLLFVGLGSSLGVFGGWGIVVFGLVVGLALYVHHAESYGGVALCVIGLTLLLAIWFVTDAACESGLRAHCSNNLRQVAFALQCYHETYNGQFPPAYSIDKSGKPLLSWRVLILPWLYDESEVTLTKIYHSYNKSERWDGPTNNAISAAQFTEFACPGDRERYQPGSAQTNYLAVVGPDSAWAGEKPRSDAEFHGAATSTIMLVEAAGTGIHWAEPRDLRVDALSAADGESPAIVPSSKHGKYETSFFFAAEESPGVNVAMADGSVHSLWFNGLSRDELRKVLQIGGCGPDVIGDLSRRPPRQLNWPNIAALAVWLFSVGMLVACAARSRRRSSGAATPSAR